MGLTLLSGVPLIYVVTSAGEHRNPVVELGINNFAEEIGTELDEDYIIKNSGPGKRFPDGLTCTCQTNILCLCEWSKNGSMASDILNYILETLDHLDIFDRISRVTHVLLIDGHGNRLGLPCLQYLKKSRSPLGYHYRDSIQHYLVAGWRPQ